MKPKPLEVEKERKRMHIMKIRLLSQFLKCYPSTKDLLSLSKNGFVGPRKFESDINIQKCGEQQQLNLNGNEEIMDKGVN